MKLNFLQMKQQKHFYLTVLKKLSKNWNSEYLILKCSYKAKNRSLTGSFFLLVAFCSNCRRKVPKPLIYKASGLYYIIPTRQVEMQSKLFCIDRLIPFSFIWYQLSQSYGVSDFLLSKSYQGMLSIAEVCCVRYLYYIMYVVELAIWLDWKFTALIH